MLKRILLVLCSSIQIFAINLRLLQGTTQVLTEPQQKYALFRGVSYAEGVAENLYNTSVKDIKIKIAQDLAESKQPADEIAESKARVEAYVKNLSATESATSKLVSQMFHRAGGQFQLTEAFNNPVSKLTPKNIGEILRIISESKSVLQAKEQSNLETQLEIYLEKLGLKKESGSTFKRKDFRPFVSALVGSLAECDPNNPQALFAPGTTEGILISYVLKRCHSKADLEGYLEGLTGEKITLSDEEYSVEDVKKIIQEGIELENTKGFGNWLVKKFITQNIQLKNAQAFGDWLVCAFYQKNYMAILPKITSNTSVLYDGISFPNCVEATILNLCNIGSYNGLRLGIAPEGLTLSSSLQHFYSTPKANMPAEVSNNKVHQAFVDMIENMSGIAYHTLKIVGKKDVLYLPSEYEGFMPIDQNLISDDELAKLPTKEISIGGKKFMLHEKKVGTAKYLLIPKGSDLACFEIMPTASNMVVALNNLFDLKLYESKDIFEQNFAQQNFSKICDKLGWMLQTSNIDNTIGTTINVCKSTSCFAINLQHKAHGYVSITKDNLTSFVDKNLLSTKLYQERPEEISELIPLTDSSISMKELFNLTGKDTQKFLQLLRNVDVRNPDRSVEVIKQVLELNLKNDVLDHYISQLIVQLPIDQHYILNIAEAYNGSLVMRNTFKIVLDRYLIQEGVTYGVLSITKALAKAKILTVQEILSLLEKGTGNKGFVQMQALSVIKELVKVKILTVQEIISLLEKKIANRESMAHPILATIVDLARAKILTIQDKDQVFSLLEKGMASNDKSTQKDTLSASKQLAMLKILTVQEILSLLEKGMTSNGEFIQARILSTISDLAQDKIVTIQDKVQIMSFLEKGMASNDSQIQYNTLSTIVDLAEDKILTRKEIVPLLKEGLGDIKEGAVYDIKYITLEVAQQLVEDNILTVADKDLLQKLSESPMYQRTLAVKRMGKGLLRRTNIDLMPHEPTDVIGKELAQHGMSAQEFGQKFEEQHKEQARLMQKKDQDEVEYHIPGFEY